MNRLCGWQSYNLTQVIEQVKKAQTSSHAGE
jgi:hypothetical protein